MSARRPSGRRAVLVSSYPVAGAVNGGERRLAALAEAYRSAGYRVASVAVHRSPELSRWGPFDLAVPDAALVRMVSEPVFADVTLGRHLLAEPAMLAEAFSRLRPDLVAVEQPFLFPAVRAALEKASMSPILVNSSHNHETEMKRWIYAEAGLGEPEELTFVLEAERQAATEADLTVVVSEQDRQAHRALGAARTILAGNGVDPLQVRQEQIVRWRSWMRERGIDRIATLTASAHPPNVVGFLDLVGTRLGYLPMEGVVALVGEIGQAIADHIRSDDPVYGPGMWARAVAPGRLPDRELDALDAVSEAVLLPITAGGGTNLKTARALVSGRGILATSTAFRGFEEFSTAPGVIIEDEPSRYRERLAEILGGAAPWGRGSWFDRPGVETLYWRSRMEPLSAAAEELG